MKSSTPPPATPPTATPPTAAPSTAMTDHPWRIAALAFVVSLAIHVGFLLPSGFDGLYGQDAYSYYGYAVGPLRTALLHFQPPPPYFWPPGYPLPITLGALLLGASPLIGQWISLLAGSLVTVLTYALGREIIADLHLAEELAAARFVRAAPLLRAAPLVAAAVTIFHPQLWQSSIVVMSDTLALAAGTLGAWALARYARLDRARWLTLAAAALAYAIATRWAYALEALPCALYGVYLLIRRAKGREAQAAGSALGPALAGGVVLGALIGPGLLGRSAATPAFTGDLEVYSWSPLNFFKRTFTTIDGTQTYRLWNGLYYALSPGHPDYFTPLLALLLAPGLWLLWRRRSLTALVLLLAWPVMILGFHAGAPWQNFRFTLAALPPLAVLVGLGAAQAAAWLGPRRSGLVLALIALGLAWQFVAGLQLTQAFIVRKDGDLALVAQVDAQTPPNAQLLTFSETATFQFYSHLDTHELWGADPTQLAALVADGRPTYVLLDVANVESQWPGLSPSNNYHWLRDGPGLSKLGQYQSYTLFQVRPR